MGKRKKNMGKKAKKRTSSPNCWLPLETSILAAQEGEAPSLPGARWSCSWRRSQHGDCRSGWKGANGSHQACRQVRCKKIRRIRSEFGKHLCWLWEPSRTHLCLVEAGSGPKGCLDPTSGECGSQKAWLRRPSKKFTQMQGEGPGKASTPPHL